MQEQSFTEQEEASRQRLGYARVSTEDQNLDMQIKALKAAGCVRIFSEKLSASAKRRPKFTLLMKNLRRGDTLVIWKLDRLNRDLMELADLGNRLDAEGVELQSLTENLDTSTAMGKFFFQMLAMFAELERNITRERTRAGIAAAKARGVQFGRPTDIIGERREAILKDLQDVSMRVADVATKHGVTTTTLAKHFPRERAKALAKLGR